MSRTPLETVCSGLQAVQHPGTPFVTSVQQCKASYHVISRARHPRQTPWGCLSGPAIGQGRARALLAFCSLSYYFVLLYQGLSTTTGPFQGVILANSKGLSNPGHDHEDSSLRKDGTHDRLHGGRCSASAEGRGDRCKGASRLIAIRCWAGRLTTGAALRPCQAACNRIRLAARGSISCR